MSEMIGLQPATRDRGPRTVLGDTTNHGRSKRQLSLPLEAEDKDLLIRAAAARSESASRRVLRLLLDRRELLEQWAADEPGDLVPESPSDRQHGVLTVPSSTERMSVYVTEGMWDLVRRAAKGRGMSIHRLMVELFRDARPELRQDIGPA